MKWIDSSVQFEEPVDATAILAKLEKSFRNCYKSEDKITEGSAEKIIRACIKNGHDAPLEHASITFRVICDRGVLAQWTRHRHASYCVESTRYCNYSKDKFGNELTFVKPYWLDESKPFDARWVAIQNTCRSIETEYIYMTNSGVKPDDARAILPSCLKTEMVCTMNIRSLRNFFDLRCSKHAHGDIRKLAIELLQLLRDAGLSVLFEDIEVE